jgi:hypothetical protein
MGGTVLSLGSNLAPVLDVPQSNRLSAEVVNQGLCDRWAAGAQLGWCVIMFASSFRLEVPTYSHSMFAVVS